MSHTTHNKTKLLNRTRRIKGQVLALEKALEAGTDCAAVLTQIAAIRGAAQSLMMEVLGGHLYEHIAHQRNATEREKEVDAVLTTLRSYFR